MRGRSLIISCFAFIMNILPGCSVFAIRSGYEQLNYKVIDKIENVEVRQYPPRVVAVVNNMNNKNEAFMLLLRGGGRLAVMLFLAT